MSIRNQTAPPSTEHVTKTGRSRGFTLLELMIVLTLIAVLVGIAVPIYKTMILRARESTLKVNLHSLREVIDQYTADKKKAPQTLQDLVDAGYFRKDGLPLDPITGQRTWREDFDSSVSTVDQTETGITDVHSLSTEMSTEGTTYDTW
jgi:general secretion pathway protein G